MRNSLAFRIIALSGVWVIMALLITALLLLYFYNDHVAQHYDRHVSIHFEELLGASGFNPDGSFRLAFDPSDPRYNILHSGWYWEVRQSGKTLQRSTSLDGDTLDIGDTGPSGNLEIRQVVGPHQDKVRVHVVSVKQADGHAPLQYLASAPMSGINEDVLTYSYHVIASFVVLGMGLLLAVVLQVRVALKPLQAVGSGIADIRSGKTARLPVGQLADVEPLVSELNNLLDHSAGLLERARNQLGDLAHSVKNPLTVINNEARELSPEKKDLILLQTREINKNVDHYLSRARTFGAEKVLGSRAEVKGVVEGLVYAMQRIYTKRKLTFDTSGVGECGFRGEGQDLEEMAGNLMDNACKWARSRLAIHCKVDNGRLLLVVEDDGPGIAENKREQALCRGVKLDESKPGYGQGLGIVKDIATLCGGSLKLGASELGGLRAELNLPAV